MPTKKRGKAKPQICEVCPFVKVISVFFYIMSAASILLGAFFVFAGIAGFSVITSLSAENLQQLGFPYAPAQITSITLIVLAVTGLILAAFGIFVWFVGKGLWKGEEWARITAIIVLSLWFLGALADLEIFSLIISAAAALFLLFSKEAKSSFKN